MAGLIEATLINNIETINRDTITLQASMTLDSILDELRTLQALEDSGEFWLTLPDEDDVPMN
ncbi:MAG: hypothetical protein RBT70_10125 [Alphaproteobacteria bacterium]|jgi:hypothetical protein|nr:hypothetical protein [Alphaproteobacteria bacterium]